MELCPIDLWTSPWVYTHLWASSLCVFVPDPWTNKTVCEKRTDSTKKDLEQMFHCPQSHFLSPALDFFFLFLFFSDGCWVVLCCFFCRSPLVWPTAQTNSKYSRLLTLHRQIRGQLEQLAWALAYLFFFFVSLCHMYFLSFSLAVYLSVSCHQTIRKTIPREISF